MHMLTLALLLPVPQAAQVAPAPRFELEAGRLWQVEDHGRFEVRPGVVSARFLADGGGLAAARLALPDLLAEARVLRENRLGIVDLELPESTDVLDAVRRLEASGLVEFACVDAVGTWFVDPDDPEYGAQWHLENNGQTGGVAGADVDAAGAWAVTTGDPSVITSVLDSGTEVTHPDLAPNLFVNPGEIANGIDDDGNGLVDDLIGWDFEGNDGDLSSSFGHGTQTAGVLCARTNNAVGLASLAGGDGTTQGCRMIPVKVGTFGPISSVIDDAILYAMDEGARVINCSFGIPSSPAVDAAIAAAHAAGVVVVVSAGNSGGSISYPANHPLTIAVGSTNDDDVRSGFSSRGPQLDLVAPGENIRTASFFGGYSFATGTSFSSPLVGSAVALLLSVDPGLDVEGVRDALRASAKDLGPVGFDNDHGDGRLDAGALLAPYACSATSYCSSTPNSSGQAASIGASGSTSVAANDLVLEADGLPLQAVPALFYYGTQAVDLPFGNGTRCAGGTTFRLPVIATTALGTASFALDLTAPPQPAGQISAGEVWYFQLWFRDPAAGGAFFDLTDGLEVRFCP